MGEGKWGCRKCSRIPNQRIAKGAGGKGPRQKTSKSVKKFFDTFRQFSRRAKNVRNRQKVSKTFSTLFDNFRASPFFRPLLQSADHSVRETGRDESQSVPSPEKLFKTRGLELPIFEGTLPSCSPHSAGYTRTFVHPYFPGAKDPSEKVCRTDAKRFDRTFRIEPPLFR